MATRKRGTKRPAVARAEVSSAMEETAKRGGTIVTNSVFTQTGVAHTEHTIKGIVALAGACEQNARALYEVARTMNGSNVTVGPCLTFGAPTMDGGRDP